MSLGFKVLALVAILLLIWFARVAWDYFDRDSPANLAMQVQLKMFGSAMYEYHAHTGRWPTKLDDLSQTSLPGRSHVWRQTADAIVVLWPQNLKPAPKDNPDVLLAYWKGGLFNSFGRVWVCWGDLRVQRLNTKEVFTRVGRRGANPISSELHNQISYRLAALGFRPLWHG
jgi:hypothetical protein